MFGIGKKKKKKEEEERKNGEVAETTHTINTHSTISSSYTETREITRTSTTRTTSSVLLSGTLGKLKLDSPNGVTQNTNKLQTIDAQPFSQVSALPKSTYRSVYSREPLSSYMNRPTAQRGSVHSLTVPSTSLSFPPIQKSSSLNYVAVPPTSSGFAGNIPTVDKKLIVKVKKSKTVYDDGTRKVPTYKTSANKNKGRVLVISNIKFLNEKHHRKGAEIDEKNIKDLFRQMGMKVDCHRDKKKAEMERIITNYRKDSSLKQATISIVVIMSHGTGKERHDSTEVVGTDGELLATTWILQEFTNENCPHLNNKPKIFIFQCCRGEERDVNYKIQYDANPFTPQPARKYADMLIAYSTVPGFVSHRDPETGTWYIQTICEVFMEHAHDTDVESLLKIVDHKLEGIVTSSNTRQTTSFENRGFKTCYLHPRD